MKPTYEQQRTHIMSSRTVWVCEKRTERDRNKKIRKRGRSEWDLNLYSTV